MRRFFGMLSRLVLQLVGGTMVMLVKIYQYTLSPLLGPRCRFWPSCSSYTIEAIQVHGPFKGGWMAAKRIVKCHPGNPGGMDPVPGGRSERLCQEDEDLLPPQAKCNHRH
ncbi:membrane protein insertion efficiency factor YidD [Halomonas sp. 7T]|uniref:membrane protein insertion efficiency factor YidD n=1 Tax=Halomonas sp. 7T TaxID=2893469 RepID=UPI0021D98FCC|nr:membrane protein insertion efficiency factor YidD [Halomonas sp. 7T]UXZ55586.1 membrane protein insertion efficiency factor YidD [Halomonas sp. 7T]